MSSFAVRRMTGMLIARLAQGSAHREAVHARHHDVEQDEIDRLRLDDPRGTPRPPSARFVRIAFALDEARRRCRASRGRRRRPGWWRVRPSSSFGGLVLLVQIVGRAATAPAELGDQRGALQTQEPRGRLLVALGAPQRFLDQSVLELLDGRVEVEAFLAERGARDLLLGDERADARGQVIDLDAARPRRG